MAAISDVDRSIFEDVTKGIHDFNEDELICLHEVAQEVKVIMRMRMNVNKRPWQLVTDFNLQTLPPKPYRPILLAARETGASRWELHERFENISVWRP